MSPDERSGSTAAAAAAGVNPAVRVTGVEPAAVPEEARRANVRSARIFRWLEPATATVSAWRRLATR